MRHACNWIGALGVDWRGCCIVQNMHMSDCMHLLALSCCMIHMLVQEVCMLPNGLTEMQVNSLSPIVCMPVSSEAVT